MIPVRDGADSIGALLDSLARQTLARERFEVVVVDNASRDDTAAVARERGARVVHEPIPNRSRARNAGVAAAEAGLIAFTDADCVARERWLEELLACAPRAPLVAGEVVTSTAEPPNAIERFERLWRFGQGAWVTQQGWAATANLLVAREAFDAVGGLDPAWHHIGEDADFCLRARDAGYGLDFCPDAVIEHRAEERLLPLLKRSYRHGYSANQAWHRLGLAERAWRHPGGLLSGRRAFRRLGLDETPLAGGDGRSLAALARASYAARVVGSVTAELKRAR
ncbi:MAG: glycosyltransferase [Actinomycetota bacterium]|nr:glycosyltransferase [Actinomycetota bacterium]